MRKNREILELDEPIFVLRAKDPCAAEVVRLWAYIRIGRGINMPSDEKINEALKLADEMSMWKGPQ